MRHRVHTFKVGRSSAHRRAMLANMVSSLFTNGQIQTTLVKAKEARRFAEKLITIGKKGDLHRRRIAVAKLRDKDAVKLLFLDEEDLSLLDDLDLSLLTEMKRSANGAVEIKLLDKLEVIRELNELKRAGSGEQAAASNFYAAIDKAADRLGGEAHEV